MMRAESEEEFLTLCENLTSKWASGVLEHFEKDFKNQIMQYSGRWLIEKYAGMYDPFSGITNNNSETLNSVLKRNCDWQELPVDTVVLGFHFLQNFDYYEILRGLSGTGDFHLKSEFSRAYIPPDEIIIPKKVVCPNDVIDYIKNLKNSVSQSENHLTPNQVSEAVSSDKTGYSSDITDNVQSADNIVNNNQTEINYEDHVSVNLNEFPVLDKNCSQQTLARYIVENNFISLVPSQGAFVVQG